jgi:hypothetical protein
MSALSPLYLLGLIAVAAPVIFHLIRRSPRGEVPFSSLLFLSASPPRLTRRSRLEHLLLLLLRAAALCLLALAFARPFLRQEAQWSLAEAPARRIAVLVDRSASMRRGSLWPRAKTLAGQAVAQCGPGDEFAVFAFDRTVQPVLSFAEAASLDRARRADLAAQRIDRLEPTWAATNLGQALIDAIGAIEDVADSAKKTARMARRVVLISDLQEGSRLDALGEFEWPSDVELELKTVSDSGSNAGLYELAAPVDSAPAGPNRERRIRVFNEPGSNRERFTLSWEAALGSKLGDPIDVYVPPGESRVVRVPPPPRALAPRTLVLTGDTVSFDNRFHVADVKNEELDVLYVGLDRAVDPSGMLYYLNRVFPDNGRRSVRIQARRPSEAFDAPPDRTPALAIVAAEIPRESAVRLRHYVTSGGTLVFVAARPGRSETLAALADLAPPLLEEAVVPRDVMLGEIAFDHPLFVPMAAAQYSDFTKIHFWKYRRLPAAMIGESRVLARFENGDAAILERPLGKGNLIVLASGWNPADSQLARSSKFVPLLMAMLDRRDPRSSADENHVVGDRIRIPAPGDSRKAVVVHKPAGKLVSLAPGSEAFDDTDLPGVYAVDLPDGRREFAVNLDPSESKTQGLAIETLEQLGCRLAKPAGTVLDVETLRQMRNAELESRQKLWRWLIAVAICVLIVETWLAGRIKRPRLAHAEVLST